MSQRRRMMNWKNVSIIVALMCASMIFFAGSCDNGAQDFPSEVSNMLTDEQINQLEHDGLELYRGSNPPNVEGIYLGDSQYCVYSSDGMQDWYTYSYYYNLSDQTGDTLTVAFDGGGGSDVSDGDLAYISGEGNNFSIFVEVNGIDTGITYTNVTVYSGTIDTDGIHDFQFGFIMTAKGPDPTGWLMDVGEDRIFIEDDYLAARYEGAWPPTGGDALPLSSRGRVSRNAVR
jgi:hypothetical protein